MTIQRCDDEFDVFSSMAKVGWAFCSIVAFEENFNSLLLTASSIELKNKEKFEEISAAAKLLLRQEGISKATLGQLVGHFQRAGVAPRDAKYLKLLVELRNEFIHHFAKAVQLPGDWLRFGVNGEQFSRFPVYVGRRFTFAQDNLLGIFERAGLLKIGRFEEGSLVSDIKFRWDAE